MAQAMKYAGVKDAGPLAALAPAPPSVSCSPRRRWTPRWTISDS